METHFAVSEPPKLSSAQDQLVYDALDITEITFSISEPYFKQTFSCKVASSSGHVIMLSECQVCDCGSTGGSMAASLQFPPPGPVTADTGGAAWSPGPGTGSVGRYHRDVTQTTVMLS